MIVFNYFILIVFLGYKMMYTLTILATFDHRVVHIRLHKNAVLFLAKKGKSEIS